MQAVTDYAADIPIDVAVGAYNGTSHSPEARGERQRQEYATTLRQDFKALAALADTEEKLTLLYIHFARYREGYKIRMMAWLRSRSRVMSAFITGPANFPVARNEKRAGFADRKMADLFGYRERALASIRKKLNPAVRPIMAGDADAEQRLRSKLAAAEVLQLKMVAANKMIRVTAGKDSAYRVAALMELGFTDRAAAALLLPGTMGGNGFPSFEIRNNGANIRRMQQRLDGLAKAKAAPVHAVAGEHARLEVNPGDNRVRLFFPGKPEAEVRARLKSNGFRWTPSLGAWQAYDNPRTRELGRQLAGEQAHG